MYKEYIELKNLTEYLLLFDTWRICPHEPCTEQAGQSAKDYSVAPRLVFSLTRLNLNFHLRTSKDNAAAFCSKLTQLPVLSNSSSGKAQAAMLSPLFQ